MDSVYEPTQVYFSPAVSPNGEVAVVKSDGTVLINPNTPEEQKYTVELPSFSHMQLAWISDEELVIATPEPDLLTIINITNRTTMTRGNWNGIFVPIWGNKNAILGSAELMNRKQGTTTTKLLGYDRETQQQKEVINFPYQKYISQFIGFSGDGAYFEYVEHSTDLQKHKLIQISHDKTHGWTQTEHSISETHRFLPICKTGPNSILVAKTQTDWEEAQSIFRTDSNYTYKIYNTEEETLTQITLNENEEIITNYGHIPRIFTCDNTTNKLHRYSIKANTLIREETYNLEHNPIALTHTKHYGLCYAKEEGGYEEAPYSHKHDEYLVSERASKNINKYKLAEHQFTSEEKKYTLSLYGKNNTPALTIIMTYPTANAIISRKGLALYLISNGYNIAGIGTEHNRIIGTSLTIRDATNKLSQLSTVKDVGLYGHSAGGTQVLFAEQTTDLKNVSCVISSCPVLACTNDSHYLSPEITEKETNLLTREYSPLHRASQTTNPTVILFGKYDTTCPPYNDLEYEARMSENTETQLLNVSHIPFSIKDTQEYNNAINNTIQKHLK